MATPKGTNGQLIGQKHVEDWDDFIKKRWRTNDWKNWFWGSKLNKTRIAKHLGFSIDVFDDNPRINVAIVESELISAGIIDPTEKDNVTDKVNKKNKLDRIDSSRLKRLEESNNLLRVDLQNLSAVLLLRQHEITVINFTLPEQKRLDFNKLADSTSLSTSFSSQLSDHSRLKETELVNINLRELKLVCQMWVDRLDVTSDLLSKALRVPSWL